MLALHWYLELIHIVVLCSPADGTQGDCSDGLTCFTNGICASQCSPTDGTQGNCQDGHTCYLDGVCATSCTPLDGTQGNCQDGQVCQTNGVCEEGKFNLLYLYQRISIKKIRTSVLAYLFFRNKINIFFQMNYRLWKWAKEPNAQMELKLRQKRNAMTLWNSHHNWE